MTTWSLDSKDNWLIKQMFHIFVRRNKVGEFGTEGVNGDWPGSPSSPRLVQLGPARQICTDSPSDTTRSGPSPGPGNQRHLSQPSPTPEKNTWLDDVNHVVLFVYIDVTSDPSLPNKVIGMSLIDVWRSGDWLIIWTLLEPTLVDQVWMASF